MASSVSPLAEKKVSASEDKSHAPSQEEEFVIAADLTLYANPLRCLNKPRNQKKQDGAAKEESAKAEDSTREIIAADLTKYGSPLDDAKH